MAQQEALTTISRVAGADLSTTGQFRFVEMDTAGKVTVCNAAGEVSIGVLQNDPSASGQGATVGILGITKVIAGGTVATNAKVTTDNQGRAVTAASTNHVQGMCVKGGAIGELIEVCLGVAPPILA